MRIGSIILVSILTIAGFVGYSADGQQVKAPRPKHVILIGIDGCGSLYLKPELKIPNIRRLMAEGSWTYNKRSALPSSTCINWESIFTAAGPEQHGFRGSESSTNAFPPLVTMKNGRFPDVFALLREAEPSAKIGSVCEWAGILRLVDTNACDFVKTSRTPDEIGIPFLVKEKPRLMLFYFEDPDGTGHKNGWGSPEYQRMLETLDTKIGNIISAVESAGMADDTVIIFSSDHGGHDKGHGSTINMDMRSPLVIWGKGIRKNYELKTSIYSYDIGATMASFLGIKLPQICIGRTIEESFETSDPLRAEKRDVKSVASHPRHVVFVGIERLGSAYIDDTVKIPNLRRLKAEGSWTLKKQSVLLPWMPYVPSPVNWSAMFMAAGGEQTGCLQHGFTSPYSDDPRGFIPNCLLDNGRFPDVYALCRAAEPDAKLGYAYGRKHYAQFVDTNICNYASVCKSSAKDGIAYLVREQPRMMSFVLVGNLENKGNTKGWGSVEYDAELEVLDKTVGEIMQAIESSAMAKDTVVIVTSDGSGVDGKTSNVTTAQMSTPLVIWGKGVRKGYELKSAIYSYDIGATMAALLGIKLPQVCTGRTIVEAFDK